MRQLTPQEFLQKVENGSTDWKGVIGRRVYGVELCRTSSGTVTREVVWADVP